MGFGKVEDTDPDESTREDMTGYEILDGISVGDILAISHKDNRHLNDPLILRYDGIRGDAKSMIFDCVNCDEPMKFGIEYSDVEFGIDKRLTGDPEDIADAIPAEFVDSEYVVSNEDSQLVDSLRNTGASESLYSAKFKDGFPVLWRVDITEIEVDPDDIDLHGDIIVENVDFFVC